MLTGFQQYFTVKLGYKFLNKLIVKDLTMSQLCVVLLYDISSTLIHRFC